MASIPDIIVTSTDSPRVLIAVAALQHNTAMESAAHRLRHYMAKMSCPVGLLVLPEELYIYRNRYTGADEKAIDETSRKAETNSSEYRDPEARSSCCELGYEAPARCHQPRDGEIEIASP